MFGALGGLVIFGDLEPSELKFGAVLLDVGIGAGAGVVVALIKPCESGIGFSCKEITGGTDNAGEIGIELVLTT